MKQALHQCKQGRTVRESRSSSFGTRGTQKYFPMNELLLLSTYPVKQLEAYGRLQKSINYEILKEFLVSNICHIKFVINIIKCTIVNISGRIPC